jgi:pimeloyl-ACP methyl ester carboxylesterase
MKLVLLPGLHGSAQLFQPLIDRLPGEIDTQIISYPAGVKLDYTQLRNMILSQLPKQDFMLLAESFSGPLAYQIASRNPKNLKAVIFVASFLDNPRPLLLNSITITLLSMLKMLPLSVFAVKTWMTGTKVSKQIISLCKQSLDILSPGLVSYRLTEIAQLRSRHWPCRCKAIYIQARHDKLVPRRCVEPFKLAFADLEIKTLNSAHFVVQTLPEDCAKVIVDTINQITASAINLDRRKHLHFVS